MCWQAKGKLAMAWLASKWLDPAGTILKITTSKLLENIYICLYFS